MERKNTFDELIRNVVNEHCRLVAEMQEEIRFLRSHEANALSNSKSAPLIVDSLMLDPNDIKLFNGELAPNSFPGAVEIPSAEKPIASDFATPESKDELEANPTNYTPDITPRQSIKPRERLHPFHPSKLRQSSGNFSKIANSTFRGKDPNSLTARERIMYRMESTQFEMAIGGLILLNTVVMACEMQYSGSVIGHRMALRDYGKDPEDLLPQANTVFEVIERIFITIFTAELLFRIFIFRGKFFCQFFNWLDVVVVFAGLLDWVARSVLDAKMLRMLRLCKIARGLRALKSVSSLDSLQLIIKSIVASMSTLMWSLIVLVVIQCISGMIISQLLNDFFDGDNIVQGDSTPEGALKVFSYYGTFSRAMITMFEVSLANWAVPCRVLLNHAGEGYALLVLGYKATCGFAVLNVVAAVFIQQTMKIMQQDTDIMLMEKQRAEINFDKKMRTLFQMLDISNDGHISIDELQSKMDDPEAKLQAYFLGIDLKDLEDMFDLVENPSSMTADDFLAAAGAIRKQAKTIDIAHILGHVKHIEYNVLQIQKKVISTAESLSNMANEFKHFRYTRDKSSATSESLHKVLAELPSLCDRIGSKAGLLPNYPKDVSWPDNSTSAPRHLPHGIISM